MSASLYQTELTNIISESKRKNHELRAAAEKALQDLKAITVTSERQLAADLAHKPSFAEPFLKACSTKTLKLATSGVNGLQRLVISQALSTAKLDEALQAFNACTELGLDLQLKVLQALPSLVQNYAEELRGDQLSSALQVCATLQGAKVSTVSAVAAATLQQLVTAVFARLAEEDAHPEGVATIAEVSGEAGPIALRPAAYDAYRVFQDLVLAAEGRAAKFVHLNTLSKEACLELVESSIEAKPRLIANHVELAGIIRSGVIPLITTAISEQLSFAVSVRSIRIIRLLSTRHFGQFSEELEAVLGLFPHAIEQDTTNWKRILIMEVLRDFFNENGLIVMAYMAYDQRDKSIIRDTLAAFVRLSSEKPAIIGLGQQSTSPSGALKDKDDSNGVAGVLSSLGVVDMGTQGIGAQWSVPKSACYEQLDKTDAPALPETYIYSMVLECLHGLSDTLAKTVLPLTVHHDHNADEQSSMSLPVNPLELDDSPAVLRARSTASLIENCWPAVLATCSTFLNAALDDSYYRALIKSYQRFAQVAGLLRLSTPRDALMTTLGKSAVPPQVLNAVVSSGEPLKSPTADSARLFSNPMNLLSIENLVNQASATLSSDKESRSSMDAVKPILTVRNLLCLRALLNLAIALGPTLGTAFAVVVDILKQADIVLSSSGAQQFSRSAALSAAQSDPPALVQSFSAEVSAVETAASRLLESTADYPDDAFVVVLDAFCRILKAKPPTAAPVSNPGSPSTPSSPLQRQRTFSGLPNANSFADLQVRNYQFVLPKLATLAALNVSRFISSSPKSSGWQRLTEEALTVAITTSSPANARRSATDLLCKLSAECISTVSQSATEERSAIQSRCFTLLLDIVRGIYQDNNQLTSLDLDVQGHVIAAVRAILDRSGDTIVTGWDKVLALVSSAFESEAGFAVSDEKTTTIIAWSKVSSKFISARLGRDAFDTVQLICTEFFSLLPNDAAPSVIELLSRFMRQTDDLNLTLTAITIVWNISDILFDQRESQKESYDIPSQGGALQVVSYSQVGTSRIAQWLLVLAKLREIVRLGQYEPAKAAFQTICSISKGNGARLPTAIWTFVLENIIIGVLADLNKIEHDQQHDLAPILLGGTAEVLAQQVDLFDSLSDAGAVWTSYLKEVRSLLDRFEQDTHCAVWQGLASILASIDHTTEKWHKSIRQTANIWAEHNPAQIEFKSKRSDGQPVLRAYTALSAQVLRLLVTTIDPRLAYVIIDNLSLCVSSSDASYYGADVLVATSLQQEAIEVLRSMPLSLQGVPARLITVVSEFAQLHSKVQPSDDRPSFVALAVIAIEWLQTLVASIVESDQNLDTTAIEHGFNCLSELVGEKYQFQVDSKGVWLWRRATSAALQLSSIATALLSNAAVDKAGKIAITKQCVQIMRNTMLANGLPTYENAARVYQDETEDIAAMAGLCDSLVPCLSTTECPQELRTAFVKACFEASLVHPLERAESCIDDSDPLLNVASVRRGRVKTVRPCRRERMSYKAFEQLLKLVIPPDNSADVGSLAEAATPWLVLRLAIPIRAYIADQPLRSRMPQPLWELEELLYALEQIKELNARTAVQPNHDQRSNGLHALWQRLYPLLIRAIHVAGDKWCGSEEVLLALQGVLESYAAG